MTKSRGEALIEEKLEQMEPGTPRYEVLSAALHFKASWVKLGEILVQVQTSQLFREWGYANFEAYCKEEIRVTRETAAKLCRSYGYLAQSHPALLENPPEGEPPPQVPDYRSVDLLAKMENNAHVPESIYRDLTQATFSEDLGVNELRKRFKEEAPEAFTKAAPKKPNPRRQLQGSLSLCARLIESLAAIDGIDDPILEQAEALRDMIAGRLEEL